MRWHLRRTAAAVILIISFFMAGPTIARPLDDAEAAYKRGDYATAYRLFKPLAENGLAEAQNRICHMYTYGKGVSQNYSEAMIWCRRAADQGLSYAQAELGALYLQRRSGQQDFVEAAKWNRRAAEQGDAPAQHALGIAYEFGLGVQKNFVFAHMWYSLSALLASARMGQLREKSEIRRDDVASRMPPAQIAEAQRLEREWKPEKER